MKLNTSIFKLGFAFLCALIAFGCTDDESVDNREHGYGYVQFKLYKSVTRADELDYLRDAHKITLSLRKDNQTLNQTVLVEEADASVSEFGLRTEKLKLLVGDYQLTGYTIYDAVDEKILSGSPEKGMVVPVKQSQLTLQRLEVNVTPRGSFRFKLIKDLSQIKPDVRADIKEERDYSFDEIEKVDLTLRNQSTGRSFTINNLKCEFTLDKKGGSYIECDSIVEAPAAVYKLERYTLWDKNPKIISTADCREDDITYTVEDNETTEAEVSVQINPTAAYIRDYLALKKLWDEMNGPEWSYYGEEYPKGANWNFDKDIDLWGAQPGVSVHSNGRIAALNLGAFNPSGPLSEAIGQFDAMVELWLGTHNDLMNEETGGSLSYNERYYSTWQRVLNGEKRADYRWQLNNEELRARHPKKRSELFEANILKDEAVALWNARRKPGYSYNAPVAARPYDVVDPGFVTNRITSLPASIGNLVNLETLFIANNLIEEIPPQIANCVSLTDVEIFNCNKLVKFPTALANMPELVLLNMSYNQNMPGDEMARGLDALFNGPSQDKIQILYLTGNNLTTIPESTAKLKKLSLLDLADNKLTSIPPLKDVALVQCYLDNNFLTTLPKNFGVLDDLESLSVTNNLLTELPNIFTTDTEYYIGSLDFSDNKISGIAGYDHRTMELTPDADGEVFRGMKATTLNLTGNRFSGGFPAAFSLSNSDVAEFNFCYNELDSIGAKGLMGLKYTTSLDLSSNKISRAPRLEDILIGQEMPFLTGIDLSYNRFTEFPQTLFNGYGITTFFFSSQIGVIDENTTYRCFTKWPSGIEKYNGIKILKMDYNDIRVVPIFPSNLNYLTINDNPNITIEIPDLVCTKIQRGMFQLEYDTTQKGITGCPALEIEE